VRDHGDEEILNDNGDGSDSDDDGGSDSEARGVDGNNEDSY